MRSCRWDAIGTCRNLNTVWMNQVQMKQCRRKVASGRRVAGVIGSLVNAWGLQFEFAKFLLETLLMTALVDGSEAMIWKEKDGFRARAVQIGQPQRFARYQEDG